MKPIRLRDFIQDMDGWYYAVAAYDNENRAGCILRYIPDSSGDRKDETGRQYRKVEFEEAYQLITDFKPEWAALVHRIPLGEIANILKPDEQIHSLAKKNEKVSKLVTSLSLPTGCFGVTGSLLCGLGSVTSDIDGVVYGDAFRQAQRQLEKGFHTGNIEPLDENLWRIVYNKRKPEINYEEFLLHEKRKLNRGQVDGTYFDLLYTRAYHDLFGFVMERGDVLDRMTIEATVTGDQFAFDSPAIYEIDHPEISRVLSFTHTYTGQARAGERIEVRGVIERHGSELWLIVGTTREAKDEWIRSLTLLEDL